MGSILRPAGRCAAGRPVCGGRACAGQRSIGIDSGRTRSSATASEPAARTPGQRVSYMAAVHACASGGQRCHVRTASDVTALVGKQQVHACIMCVLHNVVMQSYLFMQYYLSVVMQPCMYVSCAYGIR